MKRPAVDLSALTSESALPMAEAVQRAPRPAPKLVPEPETVEVSAPSPAPTRIAKVKAEPEPTKTANLETLGFKISPEFRRRFRKAAADADLKLNELLVEALDAWDEKRRK